MNDDWKADLLMEIDARIKDAIAANEGDADKAFTAHMTIYGTLAGLGIGHAAAVIADPEAIDLGLSIVGESARTVMKRSLA